MTRVTLVGKMDGARMIPIPETHQMGMAGTPLCGDIVEVLGRCYQVMSVWIPDVDPAKSTSVDEVMLIDVTHAFRLLQGGNNNDR